MTLVALLLLYPFAAAYRGLVLTVLWGWFVVPAFGLPALGLVDAIGLSLIVGFLTNPAPKKGEDTDVGWSVAAAITVPTVALIFGFLWHLIR